MLSGTQRFAVRNELRELARGLAARVPSVNVDETALEGLIAYVELLAQWNKAFNLSGVRRPADMLAFLAADSFYLADFLPRLSLPAEPEVWDLGAGAGLPGIPLRLLWTDGQYHMVERREKRALFLSTVLAGLKLPRTTVFRGSVEDFFVSRRQPRDRADAIVSRAFLPWPRLLELTRPHLRPGGALLVLAAEKAPARLPEHWMLTNEYAYDIADKKRRFWALATR
ncbi:MAG: 16S rRNA (guanine(527)-N(7))-methyltransferase RsmG [Desulfovibrio sp.]|jgi:16S rRNA (guanine527-N7)-methyltransferase|nr:16S rRNA (guanine(527)-N(7))-methyltransferase RsmG [Desulfovibrio sp.]